MSQFFKEALQPSPLPLAGMHGSFMKYAKQQIYSLQANSFVIYDGFFGIMQGIYNACMTYGTHRVSPY